MGGAFLLVLLFGPWVICGFLHIRVKELEKWKEGVFRRIEQD